METIVTIIKSIQDIELNATGGFALYAIYSMLLVAYATGFKILKILSKDDWSDLR